jgi:hypothetical protein
MHRTHTTWSILFSYQNIHILSSQNEPHFDTKGINCKEEERRRLSEEL